MTCLFCKIAAGQIPAQIVKATDSYLAFKDVDPQAPTHILLIPREHYESLSDPALSGQLLGELMLAAREIAEQANLESGYRVVTNKGDDGGQSVFHLHLHILGGRKLSWPPG